MNSPQRARGKGDRSLDTHRELSGLRNVGQTEGRCRRFVFSFIINFQKPHTSRPFFSRGISHELAGRAGAYIPQIPQRPPELKPRRRKRGGGRGFQENKTTFQDLSRQADHPAPHTPQTGAIVWSVCRYDSGADMGRWNGWRDAEGGLERGGRGLERRAQL